MKKSTGGGRGVSWRHQETLDLIRLWGEYKVQEVLASSHRNIDVFEQLAADMRSLGHTRTAVECRTKTKTLRRDYKRIVAHNGKSGNSRKTCPFFEEIHRVLAADRSIHPSGLSRNLDMDFESNRLSGSQASSEVDGSQDLFAGDLLTVNAADILTSTPQDAVGPAGRRSPEDEDLEEGSQDVETRDMDATVLDVNSEEGAGSQSTQIATRVEDMSVLRESSSSTAHSGLSSGAAGETTPRQRTLAELTAAERLERARTRKSRVALLNNVANEILEHCREEGRGLRDLQERALEEEKMTREAFMDDSRRCRMSFENAMEKYSEALVAAVEAFREAANAAPRAHPFTNVCQPQRENRVGGGAAFRDGTNPVRRGNREKRRKRKMDL